MSDRAHPFKNDDGVTLIELIVALALLALLMSYAPGALNLGRTALSTSTELDQRATLFAARSALANRLAAAVAVFDIAENAAGQLAFAGSANAISFVSALDPVRAEAGLYRTTISAVALPQPAIMLSQALFAKAPAPPETQVLLQPAAAFKLRYFGRATPEAAPRWLDDWPRTDVLPELVEIEMALPARFGPPLPPLIVEPRLRPR
jgi:prepilin-type N-terminal cleavage/methylation domain-containing protein